MTTPQPITSDDALRFPSLQSLRAAHTELLREFRTAGATPEMIARIEAFILRGRATGALLDAASDRWAAQSQLDYWATQIYQPGYQPPDATLDEFDPQLAPQLADSLCPYVGLAAFQELNQSDFFGREHLVAEFVRNLKTARFLFVLGSSGSGKSSLVRAGLIPALKKGALPGSSDWIYFTPMVPGSNPLINLARLLMAPDVDPAQTEMEAELYAQDPSHLAGMVSEKFNNPVVLVVDQFEEIFTLCTDELARQRFVDNLIGLSRVPGADHRVILTMRSDFEANISGLPELQAMFEQAAVRVTALNAGQLREAIEAPAARIGLKFEDGVVEALLKDTLGEPAGLPLLQFTLLKLWENRERNRVTWEAYRKLGGGREALARSADEFYNHLIPEDQRAMRRILLRMVKFIEGLEVTSQRVPRAALYQKAEASDRIDRVLERLIQARLVRVSEGDIAADEQVEVAHEALIRNWPRFGDWLEEERITLRQRQRLRSAAEEWLRLGRDPSALWRGILLVEASQYEDLNGLETEFLKSSYEAEKTEVIQLQERAAKLRRRSLYLTAALVLALMAIAAATLLGRQTQQQLQISRAVGRSLQSGVLRDGNFPASLLLGVEAFYTRDLAETRGTLMDNVQANGALQVYLNGHTAQVNSVAFSPDGKILASGSDDGTVILWEVTTKRLIGQLRGHTASARSVAFSPDGKTLVSGSDDHTLILWNVETGQLIHQLSGHSTPVLSVAFSPDGKTLASGSEGSTLILWDVKSGKPVRQLNGHEASVLSVAFSPDGGTLASSDADGLVLLWDISTLPKPTAGNEPPIHELTRHADRVNSVAFSPNGRILAWGRDDGTVILWDLTRELLVSQLNGHAASVRSLAFSPDGKTLVSGSDDHTLILWDLQTGRQIGQLSGHTDDVKTVAFSPDDQTLASGSADHTVALWDVSTALGASTQSGGLIGRPLNAHANWVLSIAFSPDGKTLASSGGDGQLILWDVATGQPVRQLSGTTDWVSSVAFSPHGALLASGGGDGTLTLWDVSTGQSIRQFSAHTGWVSTIAFSPDGKTLASGSYDQTVILWKVSTGRDTQAATLQRLRQLSGHTDWVRSVAFSPDGRTLASGSDDHAIILWDVGTGQPIGQPLSGHTDFVRAVAFSHDGKTLASGSDDRTIILWDLATRQRLRQLSGHTDFLRTVAFSPDDRTLASGGDDRTLILWNVTTGQPLGQPLSGHVDRVRTVAFSPDGKTLASGSEDHTLILWDIDPQSLIQKTCQRVGRNFTRAEWVYYFPNEAYRATCPGWPLEPEPTPVASPTP
ncbi:MAG TPA: WD40 repeat domain-containing protein [Anaerolineales bacterium]|nr:WD40 repeat domain-containing protein [Anaerolineales bacterium]